MRSNFVRIGLLILVASSLSGCAVEGSTPTLTERLALDYGHELIEGAEQALSAGTPDAFCDEYGSDQSMCRDSWRSWVSDGRGAPDLTAVVLEAESLPDDSYKLRFSGLYPDDAQFTSDVQVIVENTGIAAVDPVFWKARTITWSGGPVTEEQPPPAVTQ